MVSNSRRKTSKDPFPRVIISLLIEFLFGSTPLAGSEGDQATEKRVYLSASLRSNRQLPLAV